MENVKVGITLSMSPGILAKPQGTRAGALNEISSFDSNPLSVRGAGAGWLNWGCLVKNGHFGRKR